MKSDKGHGKDTDKFTKVTTGTAKSLKMSQKGHGNYDYHVKDCEELTKDIIEDRQKN